MQRPSLNAVLRTYHISPAPSVSQRRVTHLASNRSFRGGELDECVALAAGVSWGRRGEAGGRRTFDFPLTLSSKNFTCSTVPNCEASASSSASVVHLLPASVCWRRRALVSAARTTSTPTRRRSWETWLALAKPRGQLDGTTSGRSQTRARSQRRGAYQGRLYDSARAVTGSRLRPGGAPLALAHAASAHTSLVSPSARARRA